MKRYLGLIAVAGLSAAAVAQTAPAAPLYAETSFELAVPASYAETAPLFGPIGERVWAGPDWDPHFIHPQPAKDIQGAVFTVAHGPLTTVWINTLFDADGRHFQYVYFVPEMMVTMIDVRFTPVDAKLTKVHVVYTRTALSEEGNRHVAAMTDQDKRAGTEWQQMIGKYLSGREGSARR
jgi:hypothetical protein